MKKALKITLIFFAVIFALAATCVYADSGAEVYETIQDAGSALREKMKNRETHITLKYVSDSLINNIHELIWDEAMKHTGVPDEGDYIENQHGNYSMDFVYFLGERFNYTITYDVVQFTTAAQEAELTQALEVLLPEITENCETDLQKVTAIYDYICENVFYDEDYSNDSNDHFTAYNAWKMHKAVCNGYATLFYRMALSEGIECRLIPGTSKLSGESHAWNIVKIDGVFYNVDSTWDSHIKQAGKDYCFFLKGDESFDGRHIREEEYASSEFKALYQTSKKDYYETVYTPSEIIDCGEFFVETADGKVLSLMDYKNKNLLLIYGGVKDDDSAALFNFLSSHKAQLESEGIEVLAAIDDSFERITPFAQNHPGITFGMWTDYDLAVGNMHWYYNQDGEDASITYPLLFLINDNRECVFYNMGYLNESEDLISEFGDFCKLRVTERTYEITKRYQCGDFEFTAADGRVITPADLLGKKSVIMFDFFGNENLPYTLLLLSGIPVYSEFTEKGIDVYLVLYYSEGEEETVAALAEQYPYITFLKDKYDDLGEYNNAFWDAFSGIYPYGVDDGPYVPTVAFLHPNGEYIGLDISGNPNMFNALDWFSVVSCIDPDAVNARLGSVIINCYSDSRAVTLACGLKDDETVFAVCYDNDGRFLRAYALEDTGDSVYVSNQSVTFFLVSSNGAPKEIPVSVDF